jgi:dTDP-4-amino-4,6-dideoxygalactose transaminase
MGYEWDDPRDIVDIWERKVADYWGAKYAVSVDCCSHAIFLCLKYLQNIGEFGKGQPLIIPKHTYISVPMQCIHAGYKVLFKDFEWDGYYRINPTNIIDAAPMWTEGGYIKDSLMCLSMQIKKAIPIGRGGIILTDDESARSILKLMSYDGRDLTTPYDAEDHVKILGYHMYQTPEDCARGILLMDMIGDKGAYLGRRDYPDVSLMLKNI